MEPKYDVHIPSQDFWGSDDLMTLEQAVAFGISKGIQFRILDSPVVNGLGNYETDHPDKAVLFDVETEDLIAVEEV